MDEELRLEINKIVNLARDPDPILLNYSTELSPHCSSEDINQPNTSQNRGYVEEDPAESYPKQIKNKPSNHFPNLSKKNRKYLGMKAYELHFQLQGDKFLEFCQEYELIAKKVICSCGNLMQLGSKTVSDGHVWTCYNKCHTVRPQQTIRKGTWFENIKLPIANILWIAYMWVHEYSPASMQHECRNPKIPVANWCEYCLNVCREIMENKRDPIGGEGRSVEIFECKMAKDKKPTERWAFCGIEQYSTNLLELVLDNKNSNTLFQIFEKYFLPGTKVITHNWTPYRNLHQGDYAYFINDKSISFFDVTTKKNLDTFQNFKKAANRPPPGLNKWSKLEYGPSFFEKMYRKSLIYSPDAYLTYLSDISMVYKPSEKLVDNSTYTEGR